MPQDQAEQMLEGQVNENSCQAEPVRDPSPNKENKKHENLGNLEVISSEETEPIMKKCSTRQEDSGRQENSRWEEKERKESLKFSCTELRRTKIHMNEKNRGWKELDGKILRRLEKDEKKLKSDLMKMKSQKFGKAGNKKLTNLEELLITMNTRKLLEVEEIKLNLENKKTKKEIAVPEGWKNNSKKDLEMRLKHKEEQDHWKSLAKHLSIIEKLEQWLEPV